MLVYQNMLTIFVTIIMNSSCGLSRYSIRVKKLFDKLGYDFQGIELDELNGMSSGHLIVAFNCSTLLFSWLLHSWEFMLPWGVQLCTSVK
jgi:hypothetical protein